MQILLGLLPDYDFFSALLEVLPSYPNPPVFTTIKKSVISPARLTARVINAKLSFVSFFVFSIQMLNPIKNEKTINPNLSKNSGG